MFTLAAVAAVSLAACQPASDGDTDLTQPPTEEELVRTQSSEVLLDGAGLMVQATPGRETRTLALGAGRAETVAAVSEALGAPPREEGRMEECGAGPMDYVAWDRGLQLFFQDGALAGWHSTADDLNTARDIHVGSSMDDLRAAYPEGEVQETSVGWAFSIGEMYGLLDENQSRVELIRAGVNCDAH